MSSDLSSLRITQTSVDDYMKNIIVNVNKEFKTKVEALCKDAISAISFEELHEFFLQCMASSKEHIPRRIVIAVVLDMQAFFKSELKCYMSLGRSEITLVDFAKIDFDNLEYDRSDQKAILHALCEYLQYSCDPINAFQKSLDTMFPDCVHHSSTRFLKPGEDICVWVYPPTTTLPQTGWRLAFYIDIPVDRTALLDLCINA